MFMLFQGISEIRHEIRDMYNLRFVFVSAGFQEKFGFVGEEEGLQTPSRVSFDIQSAFFFFFLQKLYKKSTQFCLSWCFPVTTTRNKTRLLLSGRKLWIRTQMSFTLI